MSCIYRIYPQFVYHDFLLNYKTYVNFGHQQQLYPANGWTLCSTDNGCMTPEWPPSLDCIPGLSCIGMTVFNIKRVNGLGYYTNPPGPKNEPTKDNIIPFQQTEQGAIPKR